MAEYVKKCDMCRAELESWDRVLLEHYCNCGAQFGAHDAEHPHAYTYGGCSGFSRKGEPQATEDIPEPILSVEAQNVMDRLAEIEAQTGAPINLFHTSKGGPDHVRIMEVKVEINSTVWAELYKLGFKETSVTA